MIANIALSNFRAFESQVSVRVRPITVLIGRNSAGKSSLIKFLQMLRQTLESQREEFFATDGSYIQLGDWMGLRNSNSRSRSFEFAIEVATSDIPPALVQQLWTALAKRGVMAETGGQVRFSMDIDKPPVSRFSPVAKFTVSGKIRYAKRFESGSHVVRGTLNGREIFARTTRNLRSTTFLRFSRSTDSLNELFRSVTSEQFLDRLRYEFTSIRHLSPVREESLRAIQIGNPPPRDIGDRGEYATSHLVQIFSDPSQGENARFIERFASSVAEVDNISVRSRIASLAIEVKAQNLRTRATNYLADFGFGVSQCLPIFVQGAMQDP